MEPGRSTRALRLSAVVALLVSLPFCATRDADLLPGQSYAIQVVVTSRPPVTPDYVAALGLPRDSAVGVLHVARVEGDSLWGTFVIDFLGMGVAVGRFTEGPQVFAGSLSRDSLAIRLVTDATDAGAWLHGLMRGRKVEGLWLTDQASAAGRFSLDLELD